jgi:hypothetical protein
MSRSNGSTVTTSTTDLGDKVTHVALGAPVAVAEFVNQTIDRWRDSDQREKDLKVLRDQLDKGLAIAEEKGVTVRQDLTDRLEPAAKRVQPVADRIQPTVDRLQPRVQKFQSDVRERGGKVTDTATEQVRKVQERVRGNA